MIKAAFFDIDRTLLSHVTNSVPSSARRALELLRQKGKYYHLYTLQYSKQQLMNS